MSLSSISLWDKRTNHNFFLLFKRNKDNLVEKLPEDLDPDPRCIHYKVEKLIVTSIEKVINRQTVTIFDLMNC